MEESPGVPGLSLRLHVGFGRRNLRSGLAAVGGRNERVDGVLRLRRKHRQHLVHKKDDGVASVAACECFGVVAREVAVVAPDGAAANVVRGEVLFQPEAVALAGK